MAPTQVQDAEARRIALERGDHRSLRASYAQQPEALPAYLRADPAAVGLAAASWVFWLVVLLRAI